MFLKSRLPKDSPILKLFNELEERAGHSVVELTGQIFFVAGKNEYSQSDVWTTKDCKNWECITHAAPFGGRESHAIVVFESQLFLIGGQNGEI